MPANPDARLVKVLDALAAAADGPEPAAMLACAHVHDGGEFGVCALHPGAGLLCLSCAAVHDGRAHRDRVCDLCEAAPAVDLRSSGIDVRVPVPTRRMGGLAGVLAPGPLPLYGHLGLCRGCAALYDAEPV